MLVSNLVSIIARLFFRQRYILVVGSLWHDDTLMKETFLPFFIFVFSVMDLSQFLENKFIMERLQCRGDPAVLFFLRQFSLHRIDRWI